MTSNTPVTGYLGMPVLKFYDIFQAIRSVCEQRAQAQKEQRRSSGRRRKR